MTVIAWDGKILAADKQSTYGDAARTGTKLFKITDSEIVAFCGGAAMSLKILEWYKNGENKDTWPQEMQDSDDWSQMIVVNNKNIYWYDRLPYQLKLEDPFMAWGRGMEFAIGAMAMGATAIQAVEIASKYCEGCGMGIDYAEVR